MMVILEVYTKQVKVKYKSTLISKATFFVLMCDIFSIIIPFIIAYKSGGFWLKRYVVYEQPKINLRGEYLFSATTNNVSNPVVCSTFSYYRKHFQFLDACSLIKLREVDNNFDGKVDKITLNLGVNLFENEISSINLILPLNYEVTAICPFQMQSAIIYQYYFHDNMFTDLHVIGDLIFFQSDAIRCNLRGLYNIYNSSVVEYDDDTGYEPFDIIERYSERNFSTHLTNVYTNIKLRQKDKFNLKLTVRYPEQKVYYKPGFWQIIKWAWVQYFAVYIVTSWLVLKIKNYIFRHRLVLFFEDKSLKKNN